MKNATLYTREGCPLCDKAMALLIELQEEISFHVETVNIYEEEKLLEEYHLMIPVLHIDGKMAGYGLLEKEFIRKRLHKKE
ncbi:glutaredoxin family protein [Metabacillus sp. RGM 3146]|uniref:glutaredoxin family protein n=1 Tax=Metabacillus sp. RGM 3146 TaxID=3401092 RepID=UPI003B9A1894